MMGDSFCGWIETLRTHAAADKTRGKNDDLSKRSRAGKPLCLTISTW